MRNITLSADEAAIEAARARAKKEHTTLNEQFRQWLDSYARERQAQDAMSLIGELQGSIRTGGRRFSRDEMNER
jgi:capsule polysaccharide export protein KpsE/RkpR